MFLPSSGTRNYYQCYVNHITKLEPVVISTVLSILKLFDEGQTSVQYTRIFRFLHEN